MSEYIKKDLLKLAVIAVLDEPPFSEKKFERANALIEVIDKFPAAPVEPVVRDACGWCRNEECAASGSDYHCKPPCKTCIYNLKDHNYCPKCGRKLHIERSGSGDK